MQFIHQLFFNFFSDQLVWRAARGTGAAPTYFRAMGRMLDGGLIANNPTLDLISFMHSFYKNAQPNVPPQETCHKVGLVFSVGTGKPPEVAVTNLDVLRPTSVSDVAKVAFGAQALVEILVEQVSGGCSWILRDSASLCGHVAPDSFNSISLFYCSFFFTSLQNNLPSQKCHSLLQLVNTLFNFKLKSGLLQIVICRLVTTC